jgi:Ca2+-binding RTX toxin-like protein
MAIANELTIDTNVTDMQLAETIFGDGIRIVEATFTGDGGARGIYSGGDSTTAGVTPSDSGVILSTGSVDIFTNGGGGTDTNLQAGAGVDNQGGIDGDADLNGVSGQATFDAAIFEAVFIPDGDYLTMQFVFTSDEYPEYVFGGVNDSFGLWVNGQFVEATITVQGNVSIDTVNATTNQNLYIDNTADQFNTEMDGFTYTLSFKAPVNPGQENTIKIGIADGGDAVFDSNLLIAADSIQTVALAFDDTVQVTANGSRIVDVLANDRDLEDTGLTITEVMGQPIAVGQTITIATGEQITLNADGTLTVQADGDVGSNVITYGIVDGQGNTDIGYLTITTVAAPTVDGVVQGTTGGDLIDTSYLGDPDGDRVDSSDATGIYGTQGEDDYVLAGAGDDTVLAGDGNDTVFADDGNDSVEGGAGNDVISAGAGDDTVFGGLGDDVAYLGAGNDSFGTYQADSAGNDSVYGGSGDDFIITGGADDRVEGGTGNDTLSGGIGSDSLYGGDGRDFFNISDDHEFDSIVGGEGAAFDQDVIWFGNFISTSGVNVTFTEDEAGTYQYFDTSGTGQFDQIEGLGLTVNNDSVDASATESGVWISAHDGDDTVIGGAGADTIDGGAGSDSLSGGGGADSILGGAGDDTIAAGVDYPTFPEYTALSGTSQTLTGTNGNSDFDHSVTSNEGTVDSWTVTIDGGWPLTGYHIGNGSDASETHSHSFTQEVSGAQITFAELDPQETVTIWLDGVPVDLNAALANGWVTFDPGTTGFFIDENGLVAALTSPVFEPVPAVLTILVPFTTLDIQNTSTDGSGNGFIYDLAVDTNPPSIYGGDNDSVEAGDGNDMVGTGWGNDMVDAGTGDDTVDAGIGDDQVNAGAGNDSVLAGEGDDLVLGGLGNDTLDGGEDSDTLQGGDGADSLLGGNGDDVLDGGAGQDTLEGGDGNDSLTDTDGATLADGGTGDDSITTGTGDDTLLGGEGNDSLDAGDGADSLDGGLGDDTLAGGAGNDTLIGGTDQEIPTTQPASYATLSGTSQTVTGTAGNPDFTHDVVSDTGLVLENQETVFLPSGGTEQLSGYQVGDGTPSNEVHTHSFSDPVGSVQLRIVGLNATESLVFTLDGQPLDLNAAISLGLVSFDPGTTPYFIDGNGNLASASDSAGPFVPATLTILGPLTTLGVENLSPSGLGNGTLYELSVDSNPATETLADGNDSLSGGVGDDVLDGGSGADTLEGGDDRDTFFGDAGDVIDGGEGGTDNDTLVLDYAEVQSIAYGGGDNESGTVTFLDGSTLTFTGIENIAYAGPVDGTSDSELIGAGYIDAQGDQVDGTDGLDDTILGYGGNDIISAGAGNDLVFGGTGGDTLTGGAGNDVLHGEDGNDQLQAQSGDDTLYGGAGNDVLTVTRLAGTVVVEGGESPGDHDNLWLVSSSGEGVSVNFTGDEAGSFTFIDGTASGTFSGIEQVTGTEMADTITAGAASSDLEIWGAGGNDYVVGGAGNDLIYGDLGTDDIFAGAGNDTVYGGSEADQVYGGDGADSLLGGADNDYMQGDAGNDLVDGGTGDDFQRGDSGNDTVYGGVGNDSVYGGADDDVVFGEAGNDQVFGGFGTDTVYGGLGDDSVTGSGGNDVVHGDEGNDLVQGSDGNDTLYGGLGDDTLLGEEDADAIHGGAGDYVDGGETVTIGTDNDTLHVQDVDYIVWDQLNPENGTVHFNGGGTLVFYNIETVIVDGVQVLPPDYIVEGTTGDDLIDGSYADDPEGDRIDASDNLAGSNDDLVLAGGGNDTVLAGDGNDTVDAGSGHDSVVGGAGNDSLTGGEGNDLLDGGEGNDFLFGGSGNDTVEGGAGDDLIVLGTDGEPDRVVFSDGDGADTLDGFDAPIDNGNGTFTGIDLVDVSELTDASGDPVNVLDVIVSDDGAGNALLTFPNGETLLFQGVPPATASNPAWLVAIGIPGASALDHIVEGTGGNDVIDGAYAGDPEGDRVDAGDSATGTDDDLIEAYGGNDSVVAGLGNDTVYGDTGNDTLLGQTGNDSLYGGDGIDSLYGGDGDDLVDGGEGFGNLYGDAGNDTIISGSLANNLFGGTGDDVLTGNGGSDALYAGDGNDTLYGGTEGDQLYGGNNDDLLMGGDGNDGLQGDAGNDTLLGEAGNDFLYGGGGADSMEGGDGNDSIRGDNGNDTVFGELGDDTITGDVDRDLIYGGDGNDSLSGGTHDDTLYGGLGNDWIDGGFENDTLFGEAGNDTLLGNDGNDSIEAGAGDDSVLGGLGSDTIFGFEGNDTVDGGDGDDFINTRTSTGTGVPDIGLVHPTNPLLSYPADTNPDNDRDSVQGGLGNDTILTGDDADTVYGGAGNDSIDAGFDADLVYGGDDADTIEGGEGADTISGDAGNDLIFGGLNPTNPDYAVATQYDLTDDIDPQPANNADSLSGGEGDDTIYGLDDADTLMGDGGNDLLDGGIDNDLIDGGIGNDTLFGGHGSDTVYGGAGNDQFEGGAGNDSLFGLDDADTILGGAGDDMVDGDEGDDSLAGNEGNDTLVGDGGADSLTGGNGDDQLYGGLGNDYFEAGDGDDSLYGGDGNDAMNGDAGNDLMDGGAGDDAFNAGDGDDTLYGGAGIDDLRGVLGNDLIYGGDDNDRVLGGDGNDTLYGDAGNDSVDGGVGNDTLYGGVGVDTIVGGDDRDRVIVGAGEGIGSIVDGGEGGDDYDTLDLSGWGRDNVNIIYGGGNNESGTVEFLDAGGTTIGTMSFSNIERVIPCFTPGALIATDLGEVRVEQLRVGDRVLTRDNGYQAIRWIGRRELTAAELQARSEFQPIRIRRGALGLNLPDRDLTVSPQHRMLVTGSRAELLFGETEVLVAAAHLEGRRGVERQEVEAVSYLHILFDQHEIIRANGAWTESFQPGEMTLAGMEDGPRDEVLSLFPELKLGFLFPAARITLRKREAILLFQP